jgi:uncharacterized membrane protein YvbJ
MNMNKCPECGQQRQADEYRCLACGCFYSQLDEFLATEAAQKEKNSFTGRIKAIWHADDSLQALKTEYQTIPRRTIFTLWVIFAFIFAMTLSVL